MQSKFGLSILTYIFTVTFVVNVRAVDSSETVSKIPSKSIVVGAGAPTGADPTLQIKPQNDPALSGTGNIEREKSGLDGLLDPYDYDPRERRDPFSPPIAEKALAYGAMHGPVLNLQRFNVSELRLSGVIWDVSRPKALITDPNGKTHVVGKNAKIGLKDGYIAVIREGEIVIVETVERDGKLLSTAQVVKLSK